jgi:ribosomal protein S18 acetylase RimI-like enzyme
MYGGHFPPLGEAYRVHPPPVRLIDGADRVVDLRRHGEGPVADERAALVDLYRSFDPADRTLGIPPATESRIRGWQDDLLAGHCVLAWHDDRLAGQAALVGDRGGEHELAVFLDSAYQGAGIGTRLTETLLSLGRERGVRDVWLVVERANQPAVQLYRDVGFVVVDEAAGELEMGLSMNAERLPVPPGAAGTPE